MITVIDYDIGNLGSVIKAFDYLEIEVKLTSNPEEIKTAEGIILPGVGAFREGMENLLRLGFEKVIKDEVAKGKPFFGICLGMQLLFDSSEEDPGVSGLSLIPGRVVRFKQEEVGKIPQIGWNQLELVQDDPIFSELDKEYFYFVHSYYVQPDNEKYIVTQTGYGSRSFPSVVRKDNVWGMQCHPEKSSQAGLQVLKKFSEVVVCGSNTGN